MDDLQKLKDTWLGICGACDAGIGNCSHPDGDYRPVMLELVREVERLRKQLDDNQRFLGAAIHDAWILEGAVDGARISRNQMEKVFNEMVLREGLANSALMKAVSGLDSLRAEIDREVWHEP